MVFSDGGDDVCCCCPRRYTRTATYPAGTLWCSSGARNGGGRPSIAVFVGGGGRSETRGRRSIRFFGSSIIRISFVRCTRTTVDNRNRTILAPPCIPPAGICLVLVPVILVLGGSILRFLPGLVISILIHVKYRCRVTPRRSVR